MERFTRAIQNSLDSQNWFAALSLSLMLPDICGALEKPNSANGDRYRRWFKAWMQSKYTVSSRGISRVILSAEDCWQLRNSYLHAGNGEVKKASSVLQRFHFIQPPGNGNIIHRNTIDSTLQLQVDVFCSDMIEAVQNWDLSISGDTDVQERKKLLLTMHTTVPGILYTHDHE